MSLLTAPTCRRCLFRAFRASFGASPQHDASSARAPILRSTHSHARDRGVDAPTTRRVQSSSGRSTFRIHKPQATKSHDSTGRNPRRRSTAPASNIHQNSKEFEALLSRELRSKQLRDELLALPIVADYLKRSANDGEQGRKNNIHSARLTTSQSNEIWTSFTNSLAPSKGERSPWQDLQRAFRDGYGLMSLKLRIKYHFCTFVLGDDDHLKKAAADLRYPAEWYPRSRTLQRQIHIHVGPTNSGKTYHALQRLEQAETGIYAGPLRLLAHEVYARLNAKGRPCWLMTGEEHRPPTVQREADPTPDGAQLANPDDDGLISCTVEMVPCNKAVDVAVIDEIQMIGNHDRGWAWTDALLGVQAKEIHLCGEARTVPLIRAICAAIGDKVQVHEYERLSPLKVADYSLQGDLTKLVKGDCVVSFSVMGIHALRRQIERLTGKKVATVYGSLPPETRAQQARLFNDPDNDYDFLVASDAVGMGLNLAIKRVILETTTRFNGRNHQLLEIADIKQIAGRAGRFRVAGQDVPESSPVKDKDASAPATPDTNGLVTTLEAYDISVVRHAMRSEAPPIEQAGILAPQAIIERFAKYFPLGTPLTYIVARLYESCQTNSRFFICALRDQLGILDAVESVRGLSTADRVLFAAAPFNVREPIFEKLLPALARCIAEQKGGNILDLPDLPLDILDQEISPDRQYLRALESLHKGVTVYLWLSYRFYGVFRTRPLAFHIKSLVEDRIEAVLNTLSFSEETRRKLVERRQRLVENEQALLEVMEKSTQQAPANDAEDVQEELEVDTGLDLHERNESRNGIASFPATDSVPAEGLISGEQDIPFEDPETAEYLEAEQNETATAEEERPDASQKPPSVPPKHLSDFGFSNVETERDVTSRP